MLTQRQERTILAILDTPSLEEARRRVKAGKSTFYGWMKEPAFKAELKIQRATLVEEALERLGVGLAYGVNTLLKLLREQDNPNIQLRAAQTLLDNGFKAIELQALAERVEALEKLVLRDKAG